MFQLLKEIVKKYSKKCDLFQQAANNNVNNQNRTIMKRTFLKIIFTTLVLTVPPVLAQNETNQYEKTETEIINLINSPDPSFSPDTDPEPMDAKAIADLGFEQVYQNKPKKFLMRDGKQLFSYAYEQRSDTTIVLLHGVLSSAYMMNKTAGLLRDAAHSEVIA